MGSWIGYLGCQVLSRSDRNCPRFARLRRWKIDGRRWKAPAFGRDPDIEGAECPAPRGIGEEPGLAYSREQRRFKSRKGACIDRRQQRKWNHIRRFIRFVGFGFIFGG